MRITRGLTLSVAVLALVLTGCSGDQADAEAPTAVDSAQPATTPGAEGTDAADAGATDAAADADEGADNSTGDPTRNGADATGIDMDNPPEPIGEVIVPINKNGITATKVELLQLKDWEDRLTVAVFRVTPQGNSRAEVPLISAIGEAWTPVIADLQDLKKYSTVTELRTNQHETRAELGSSMYAWAAFPKIPTGNPINVQPSSLGPFIEGLTAP